MFDYAQYTIGLNDIDDDTMNKFNDEILKSFELSLDWKHVPFMLNNHLTVILEIEIIKIPESLKYKFNDIQLHLPKLLTDFIWSSFKVFPASSHYVQNFDNSFYGRVDMSFDIMQSYNWRRLLRSCVRNLLIL